MGNGGVEPVEHAVGQQQMMDLGAGGHVNRAVAELAKSSYGLLARYFAVAGDDHLAGLVLYPAHALFVGRPVGDDHNLATRLRQELRYREVKAAANDGQIRIWGQAPLGSPTAQIFELRFIVYAKDLLGPAFGVIAHVTAAADDDIGLDRQLLEQSPVAVVGGVLGHHHPLALGPGDGDTPVYAHHIIGVDERPAKFLAKTAQAMAEIQPLKADLLGGHRIKLPYGVIIHVLHLYCGYVD